MADLAWRPSSLTSRNSRVSLSSSAWDASLIQPDSLCVQCANFCGSSVALLYGTHLSSFSQNMQVGGKMVSPELLLFLGKLCFV